LEFDPKSNELQPQPPAVSIWEQTMERIYQTFVTPLKKWRIPFGTQDVYASFCRFLVVYLIVPARFFFFYTRLEVGDFSQESDNQ